MATKFLELQQQLAKETKGVEKLSEKLAEGQARLKAAEARCQQSAHAMALEGVELTRPNPSLSPTPPE